MTDFPRNIFRTDSGLLARTMEISLGNSGYEYKTSIAPVGLPYIVTGFCPLEVLHNHYHMACDLFPLAASRSRCELSPRQ